MSFKPSFRDFLKTLEQGPESSRGLAQVIAWLGPQSVRSLPLISHDCALRPNDGELLNLGSPSQADGGCQIPPRRASLRG